MDHEKLMLNMEEALITTDKCVALIMKVYSYPLLAANVNFVSDILFAFYFAIIVLLDQETSGYSSVEPAIILFLSTSRLLLLHDPADEFMQAVSGTLSVETRSLL